MKPFVGSVFSFHPCLELGAMLALNDSTSSAFHRDLVTTAIPLDPKGANVPLADSYAICAVKSGRSAAGHGVAPSGPPAPTNPSPA